MLEAKDHNHIRHFNTIKGDSHGYNETSTLDALQVQQRMLNQTMRLSWQQHMPWEKSQVQVRLPCLMQMP